MHDGHHCFITGLKPQIRHRPQARAGRKLRILREHTTRVTRLRLLPLGEAGLQFRRWDSERDRALLGVDGDLVAVLDDGDRAADIRFGCDVADDEAVAASAEAAVGDEGDVFAEAFAHDG